MRSIQEITSRSNPRFKELKALSKSRNRKKSGMFLLEGRPEVDHAIRTNKQIKLVVFSEAYITLSDLNILVDTPSVEVLSLSKSLFDEIAYQHVPGNLLLLLESWSLNLNELNAKDHVVVLDGLEKPGNLGAILRTCDAAGIGNVIVSESAIDLFNPNVLRNSRGAIFSTDVVFCDNASANAWLDANDYKKYAAILSDGSTNYRNIDTGQKSAIICGAESKGLSAFWSENSNDHVMIPMAGIVDSLNLSVSVGILLSHLKM